MNDVAFAGTTIGPASSSSTAALTRRVRVCNRRECRDAEHQDRGAKTDRARHGLDAAGHRVLEAHGCTADALCLERTLRRSRLLGRHVWPDDNLVGHTIGMTPCERWKPGFHELCGDGRR